MGRETRGRGAQIRREKVVSSLPYGEKRRTRQAQDGQLLCAVGRSTCAVAFLIQDAPLPRVIDVLTPRFREGLRLYRGRTL